MEEQNEVIQLLKQLHEKIDNVEEEILALREDFEEAFLDEDDEDYEGEEYEEGEEPEESLEQVPQPSAPKVCTPGGHC